MEPSTWQALFAMCLVERSGFGLNALLAATRTMLGDELFIVCHWGKANLGTPGINFFGCLNFSWLPSPVGDAAPLSAVLLWLMCPVPQIGVIGCFDLSGCYQGLDEFQHVALEIRICIRMLSKQPRGSCSILSYERRRWPAINADYLFETRRMLRISGDQGIDLLRGLRHWLSHGLIGLLHLQELLAQLCILRWLRHHALECEKQEDDDEADAIFHGD